jgi:hypothetical protein
MVFGLAQHHKYQISEIENLIPFERDIYFRMLLEFIESQKEQQKWMKERFKI